MSTRSSARRLLSPIEDPEKLISRRNQSEPSLLFDLEENDMAGQAPPQVPIPDLCSMEELLQAPTDGVGDAIVVPPILANQFELKTGLLNLVTAISFHGFENDDPRSHIRCFTKITQTVKLNQVPPDVIKLMLFPFSFEGATRTWLDKEPPNSITTWNDLRISTKVSVRLLAEAWDRFKDLLNKSEGNFLTKNTQEALTIIKNKSKVQTSRNKPQVASASGSSSQDAHISSLTKQVEALLALHRPVDSAQNGVNYVQNGCETCGGPHPYFECQATGGYTQDVYATSGTYNQGGNSYQPLDHNTNMSNKMDQMQKVLMERPQGVLPSNTVPNPREDLKAITTRSGVTLAGPSVPPPPLSSSKEVDQEPETITDSVLTESTTSVPPPVVQPSPASTEPPHAPVSSPVIPKPSPHQPSIPYPSTFAKALAHMPKFAKMVKDLLTNKEKLLEMANTPLNENCSAVLLKKLPEKLGDTGRFLIPCDFYGIESCMALADLGASINLMPLSVWKTLSLPDLSSTRMTLELATRTVAYPTGIAEDVFIQVGKFTFLADFVVVDYELTLRVGDEELVFNVISTSKYPQKHGDESIHKIDILDITCEDHFYEVLNVQKSINTMSGSPTPSPDPVLESLSPSLTPFGDSDFLLEETDAFLSLNDSILPSIDNGIYDSKGDILFLEELLNEVPTPNLPHIPLPVCLINETEKIKSSINDPPDLELKDLPPYLEYAYLEGTSKLPVIIAKDLKREEKEQLLKILKEDAFKPAVQHQRRVNPKIHEVIKAEVIKLLDVGLIYPISDSPWVSPIHVVPKKGGMTVITNENNELIPTRLVTSWRVCIDYQKLNDATRKDHFPIPFMDQMLERLAGNEFYCFLDGFSGYFQIPINPQDQDKTTFTCPYGTFAYRRIPFGLCNAPGTFQRLKKGIVLGHKISKSGIEVDRAKIDVISKLLPPTTVKGIRSFLGHAGFYRRFIKDFSKISRPMTHLLEKGPLVSFLTECQSSFEILKKKLTEAPILVSTD
ncbi:reverse transcriptase domain-containing protein [Tanacetum coccineum]